MKQEPVFPPDWGKPQPELISLRIDPGDVNPVILSEQDQTRFKSIEGASVRVKARFVSPEGKRLFVRLYQYFQVNVYIISVIARSWRVSALVPKAEAQLAKKMQAAARRINALLDETDHAFRQYGILQAAGYEAAPLWVEVGVMSFMGRQYLELIERLDQLMPMLYTLEIEGAETQVVLDRKRSEIKHLVKRVASAASFQARALRLAHYRADPGPALRRPAAAAKPQASAAGLAPETGSPDLGAVKEDAK
jgi:hypothetical protein